MKKFNTALIMKTAHKNAKLAAKKHGGKSSEYFAECLKLVWLEVKRPVRKALKKGFSMAGKIAKAIVLDVVSIPNDLATAYKSHKYRKHFA